MLCRLLVGNLVMGNLVNRDYEPVLAQAGDTVNVPIPPTMVANNILEGGTVQPQNPTLGNAQIVLNTHAEATFQIPDVTKVLAVPDLLKIYMEPAVAAIAQSIETTCWACTPGSQQHAGGNGGNDHHGSDHRRGGNRAVPGARSRPREQKFMVVDAATYSAWRQIPRFSEFQTAGDAGLQAMIEGTIGKIKDFFVFRSQFVQKTGSSPVNTHNMAFTKDAIGLVIRRLPQPLPGTGAHRGVRRAGQFRHARGDELPAEHAGAAVHGGCALRLRRSAQPGGRAGEHVGSGIRDRGAADAWPQHFEKETR